eukprot:2157594-Pleurochrysis_carterae.AAC.2
MARLLRGLTTKLLFATRNVLISSDGNGVLCKGGHLACLALAVCQRLGCLETARGRHCQQRTVHLRRAALGECEGAVRRRAHVAVDRGCPHPAHMPLQGLLLGLRTHLLLLQPLRRLNGGDTKRVALRARFGSEEIHGCRGERHWEEAKVSYCAAVVVARAVAACAVVRSGADGVADGARLLGAEGAVHEPLVLQEERPPEACGGDGQRQPEHRDDALLERARGGARAAALRVDRRLRRRLLVAVGRADDLLQQRLPRHRQRDARHRWRRRLRVGDGGDGGWVRGGGGRQRGGGGSSVRAVREGRERRGLNRRQLALGQVEVNVHLGVLDGSRRVEDVNEARLKLSTNSAAAARGNYWRERVACLRGRLVDEVDGDALGPLLEKPLCEREARLVGRDHVHLLQSASIHLRPVLAEGAVDDKRAVGVGGRVLEDDGGDEHGEGDRDHEQDNEDERPSQRTAHQRAPARELTHCRDELLHRHLAVLVLICVLQRPVRVGV